MEEEYNLDTQETNFVAVGDIMLGDSPKCIGIGVRSAIERNGADYLFANIRNELRGDIVFGNFECISFEYGYQRNNFKKAQMNCLSSSLASLKRAGFNVLNIANNHIMQFGTAGFNDTCNSLRYNGFDIVGRKKNGGEFFSEPYILTTKGHKIGILGYSLVKDNYCIPENTSYASANQRIILADVIKLKSVCDKIIVSLHRGDEFVRSSSLDDKNNAKRLIDEGVDLVIGHHSHVFQEIERYNGRYIIYGLGNFVTDMLWDERTRFGLLIKYNITNNNLQINICHVGDDYSLSILNSYDYDSYCVTISNDLLYENNYSYASIVSKMRIRNRNLAHLYLLKNCFRYNFGVMAQILGTSLKSVLGL